MLHLLKGSLGTGILAMPNAFLRAGYVLGVAGTVFIGIICTYCVHQLVSACRMLLSRNWQTNPSKPSGHYVYHQA
jgi:proton-coupled amino acid transporter